MHQPCQEMELNSPRNLQVRNFWKLNYLRNIYIFSLPRLLLKIKNLLPTLNLCNALSNLDPANATTRCDGIHPEIFKFSADCQHVTVPNSEAKHSLIFWQTSLPLECPSSCWLFSISIPKQNKNWEVSMVTLRYRSNNPCSYHFVYACFKYTNIPHSPILSYLL